MAKSLAYWRRLPGLSTMTRPHFQRAGSRMTNWESWFQPGLALVAEVSGK
ncbi:hypothetical protein [Microbispora sp. NPDC046933]